VCSAHEVTQAGAAGMRTMVPGIRLAGGARHDQARVATPGEAITTGASWIILGRAITAAPDPEAAAAAAANEVAAALARA
jgi:orotidine-5'-phosphate decarboxylase